MSLRSNLLQSPLRGIRWLFAFCSAAFASGIAYSTVTNFNSGDPVMLGFAALVALFGLCACIAVLRCRDASMLRFVERVFRYPHR
jgi:hypothetical protein